MRTACLICLTLSIATGCGRASVPPSVNALDGQMVYVDTVSRRTFLGQPTEELPAVHPESGQRTLMPGLYCAKCRAWYPAPPLEVRQRQPSSLRCPKSGDLMTPDGPPPGNE